MSYSCPVCSSSAVDAAGQTDTYQSIICRECHAWSTIPIQPPRAKARTTPDPAQPKTDPAAS